MSVLEKCSQEGSKFINQHPLVGEGIILGFGALSFGDQYFEMGCQKAKKVVSSRYESFCSNHTTFTATVNKVSEFCKKLLESISTCFSTWIVKYLEFANSISNRKIIDPQNLDAIKAMKNRVKSIVAFTAIYFITGFGMIGTLAIYHTSKYVISKFEAKKLD